ncbi:21261_t:CDS:2 [Racocetra persica]|uniref:21261_t:CDS:1 n=1 Tax=Racocetra persica TaxID=160502 RepID=A0ACA9KS06_9GLOM|nr:21261_t:CDS:2 [Racocetra persica]
MFLNISWLGIFDVWEIWVLDFLKGSLNSTYNFDIFNCFCDGFGNSSGGALGRALGRASGGTLCGASGSASGGTSGDASEAALIIKDFRTKNIKK